MLSMPTRKRAESLARTSDHYVLRMRETCPCANGLSIGTNRRKGYNVKLAFDRCDDARALSRLQLLINLPIGQLGMLAGKSKPDHLKLAFALLSLGYRECSSASTRRVAEFPLAVILLGRKGTRHRCRTKPR